MFPRTSMHTGGAEQLALSLEQFGPRVARRVIAGGLRSGALVLARAQRAAAPQTQTPGGKADIKAAIGYRVLKQTSRTLLSAKAGGGVGGGSRLPKIRKQGSGKRGGVGISARNIHWLILGTADRYTGAKSWTVKKGGKKVGRRSKSTGGRRLFRGRMLPEDFIRRGSEAAAGSANFAMRSQIAKGIGREWAKRQKKLGSRY
jgi:hypothetical protein